MNAENDQGSGEDRLIARFFKPLAIHCFSSFMVVGICLRIGARDFGAIELRRHGLRLFQINAPFFEGTGFRAIICR